LSLLVVESFFGAGVGMDQEPTRRARAIKSLSDTGNGKWQVRDL